MTHVSLILPTVIESCFAVCDNPELAGRLGLDCCRYSLTLVSGPARRVTARTIQVGRSIPRSAQEAVLPVRMATSVKGASPGVQQVVVCRAVADDQVAVPVVVPDAVDMVDVASSRDRTTKCIAGDQNVLRDVSLAIRQRVVLGKDAHVTIGPVASVTIKPGTEG
jgi:hypothetical protein